MNDFRGARWASGLAQLAVEGTVGFFAAMAWSTALQPAAYDSTRDFVSGLARRGASGGAGEEVGSGRDDGFQELADDAVGEGGLQLGAPGAEDLVAGPLR